MLMWGRIGAMFFFLFVVCVLVISLIVRLFFSHHKKLILSTLVALIVGAALLTWGEVLLVGIGAHVSGGGLHQQQLEDPFPFLIFGLVLLVASVPCSLVGLFKQ